MYKNKTVFHSYSRYIFKKSWKLILHEHVTYVFISSSYVPYKNLDNNHKNKSYFQPNEN